MARTVSLSVWQRLGPAAPALGLGLLVLGLLFHAEAAAAVQVWNSSTAYGHCWLVLPIVLWLAWERRAEAAAAPLVPTPWPALLGVPLVAAWLGADLLGIMEGRQLAAIGLVEVLLLACLGWRLWWALAVALLYLVFLVPFGAFVTPWLQDFTAAFVARGLDLLAIPNAVTAYRIEIPEGSFYVAEACAGLRFLIASIAFGVLYALTMFVSAWRRVAFVAVSVVTPVIANGFRALGIVVLGHLLGSAEAAETDHILYGWIFFSLVILMLAAAGMPFREDFPPAPAASAASPPGTARRALLAAWPVLAVAALAPVVALWLDGRAGTAPSAAAVLVVPDGCQAESWRPEGPVGWQGIRCGDTRFAARLEVLPARANPAKVIGAAQTGAAALLPGAALEPGRLEVSGASPALWTLARDDRGAVAAVSVLVIEGRPTLGGVRDRLHLASGMFGGGSASVALTVAVTAAHGDPSRALEKFLAAQGNLAARLAVLGQ